MTKVIGVRSPTDGIVVGALKTKHGIYDESLYKLMMAITTSYNSTAKRPWVNNLDYILLQILKKYNFAEGELGTEYYATVLRQIIFFLESSATNKQAQNRLNELRAQVLNPYSQFYLDIIYDFGTTGGLKTFHGYISASAEAARVRSKMCHQDHLDQREYRELAFTIAEIVFSEIKAGNINVEERKVDARDFTCKLRKESNLHKSKVKRQRGYF